MRSRGLATEGLLEPVAPRAQLGSPKKGPATGSPQEGGRPAHTRFHRISWDFIGFIGFRYDLIRVLLGLYKETEVLGGPRKW